MQAEIAERKRVEVALRESEEKYRRLFNSMGEAFALCEIILSDGKPFDAQILEVNPAHETMTGLTAEKTIGRTIRKLIPDIEDWWFEIYGRVALGGETIRFENYIPGLNRWFDIYAYKIEEDDDKKFALIYSDITERKQALIELHQSEERYRTLFDSIDEGFCVIEMLFDENDTPFDYRFLEINPAFEKQTGLQGAPGKTMRQLVPNLESHWFEIYGKVALTGEPLRFENGSAEMNRWFDVYAFRIGQPSSRKVALIFKDISEAKRIEGERERILQREQTARETAERANRIKDEFLAVLSHELRSPLNPILGWTKLLRSGKLNEAKTVEALATIERNAQLQTQLIGDLLDISRIMRGKLTLSSAPVSLSFVISAALETVRLAAEAKMIQIKVIEVNVGQVYGDAGRLQQVIWNLLSNAVKFTSAGGQVEIRLTQTNNFAQIQISDTGKRVKPEFLPYVFEHFRQEDSATTRKFGGLGLGLAIARQITELHGGRIWVESSGENQGATFTVELPLNTVDTHNVETVDLNIP
ncbi:PAS/PAC sensor hybrid histidine kinase [Calothrix sp. NIES-4071]|nr:PAS/PAC sensor hybrid histidine kinase [Calothrix sp. NIES-4071]BAZ56943.1 PAS/PAC sensor hybrid histidine kinase [Calothrix sp. NIES-4105]